MYIHFRYVSFHERIILDCGSIHGNFSNMSNFLQLDYINIDVIVYH